MLYITATANRKNVFAGRSPKRSRRFLRPAAGGSFLAVCAVVFLPTPDARAVETTRANVDSTGAQSIGGESVRPAVSDDGRYIAFQSTATNLVLTDTNAGADIFLRDRQGGTTLRMSLGPAGVQANGGSYDPAISNDGRYVTFHSYADNLVPGDTNSKSDVFVRDILTNTTTRVSVGSAGAQGTGHSNFGVVSNDGRYVAFASAATNLVAGDTNAKEDVFLRDTVAGTTNRLSVDSIGAQANDDSVKPTISSDGRYVAFSSPATNLVAGDTNASVDIFRRDTQAGTTTRVSRDSAGVQAGASSFGAAISDDGRFVAFQSYSSNLVAGDTNSKYDIFRHDAQTGTTARMSVDSAGTQGDAHSYHPSISSDGRYVAFDSFAGNLVATDTNSWVDIFVRDAQAETTTRASVSSAGVQANYKSEFPAISGSGRYIAFDSGATNLVAGDTNAKGDIFLRVTDVPIAPPIEPAPTPTPQPTSPLDAGVGAVPLSPAPPTQGLATPTPCEAVAGSDRVRCALARAFEDIDRQLKARLKKCAKKSPIRRKACKRKAKRSAKRKRARAEARLGVSVAQSSRTPSSVPTRAPYAPRRSP